MKSLLKDSMSMTKTSLILGVGATAVTKAGGNAAGLSALSQYTPVIGSTMGAGHALKLLKKLK